MSMGRKQKENPPSSPVRARGRHRLLLLGGGFVLVTAVVSTIFLWPLRSDRTTQAYALAPESALPANIRQAPPNVRDAYRFAIANRDILRQIPCYCGCGAEHQSNAECYIKEVKPNGEIIFDPMSFG
jgi:hypothetical protein